MRIKRIYKLCRTCKGRKEVEVTLTYEQGEIPQVLPCPHCKGHGHTLWGYMEEEYQDFEKVANEFASET